METKLILYNRKNYEITTENPRDFEIGDTFYFSWGGIEDVQEVSDERIQAEVNGTIPKSSSCIDLTYNFWRCVRKVITH